MARRRSDPLEDFLDQLGDDISATLADLGDGLLVAGIAALTGLGVAKAAPAIRKAASNATVQAVAADLVGLPPPDKIAKKSRAQRPRKALSPANARARTPSTAAGEVIDLLPGPDGVYR